jgi:hypothetical protein
MRDFLFLERHLPPQELERRYRACPRRGEARRWHLLWLLSRGWDLLPAAGRAGLSPAGGREILTRYNARGPAAIVDRPRKTGGREAPRRGERARGFDSPDQALRDGHRFSATDARGGGGLRERAAIFGRRVLSFQAACAERPPAPPVDRFELRWA